MSQLLNNRDQLVEITEKMQEVYHSDLDILVGYQKIKELLAQVRTCVKEVEKEGVYTMSMCGIKHTRRDCSKLINKVFNNKYLSDKYQAALELGSALKEPLEELISYINKLVAELTPAQEVEVEEAEEILTVSDLFKAISEQYEAGVTSETDHYWDGYSCLDPIETDEVKDRLQDIVAMLKYLHSETLGSSQINNREVCIENVTDGEFDEIISRGFGDEFAEVLEQAESECEEYEVVGRITQDNLDDFEEWCSKVDNLVYERVDFPNRWNIVNCIQANTESVYNFDFVERFSSAVAYENFYPDGFLCDYLEAAKDCLEEYAYELETYLNLAIQMTLEWEKSQKENKETTCNE